MGTGNWTGDSTTEYRNHRLISDAKFFPKNEEKEQPAATFVTVVHGTKNGEDIFVNARVIRGAEKAGGLKKGTEVSVRGTVEFSLDRNGKLQGKIWDAQLSYGSAVRSALAEAAAPPAEASAEPEGDAPAFT